jgi:L-lactate utilization protein LutB
MDRVREWYVDEMLSRTVVSLERNGFLTICVHTREEALQWLLSTIPIEATVGVGGSVTLRDIGIVEALRQRGNIIYEHWKPGLTSVERREVMRGQLTSDIFLASSNAVTETGKLVNVDNSGNRVASTIFGPSQVILTVGMNKIVRDLTAGLDRVRNVAAPMDCRRIGRKTPCIKTGRCEDCDSPDRLCRALTIIERVPSRSKITVLLVKEPLGF